jgi:hypothetical protein
MRERSIDQSQFRVFQGEVFVFQVEGARFTIHKPLVSRKSGPLRTRMESVKHKLQREVTIVDADVHTFSRFVEFIYTGDYTPAPPSQSDVKTTRDEVQDTEDASQMTHWNGSATAIPEPPIDDMGVDVVPTEDVTFATSFDLPWGSSTSKKKSKKFRLSKHIRRDDVSGTTEALFAPTSPSAIESPTTPVDAVPTIRTDSKLDANPDWTLDYLPLLLSHAKLYVFADTHEIRDLQKLAARRLDEVLEAFEFRSPNSTDIAALLQYVYKPDVDVDTKILKTIVVNFVARHIENLIDYDSFRTLIEQGGSLGLDILCKTVCRL